MGVDPQVLRFLNLSRRRGVSFRSTMMIGRQNYNHLIAEDLSKEFGFTSADSLDLLNHKYIEPLLKRFGAESIESMDNSEYEGASVIHDLNRPVPEHLKGVFSCVLDGGAIEHVFHFPQAIANLMEMTAVHGHLLEITAANNFMGHGFYQFSPELFFRVLSHENGFRVDDLFLCETDRDSPLYRITDPRALHHRLELVNYTPTYLMVIAQRIECKEVLRSFPQQSDYVEVWSKDRLEEDKTANPLRPTVHAFVPEWAKKPARVLRQAYRVISGSSRQGFRSEGYQKVQF